MTKHLIDTRDAEGHHLLVDYVEGKFLISVFTSAPDKRTLSKVIQARHEPRWGIDVDDTQAIYEAAEALILQLDAGEGTEMPSS